MRLEPQTRKWFTQIVWWFSAETHDTQRQVFEIGWQEDGQDLALWIHIVPEEVNEDDLDDE